MTNNDKQKIQDTENDNSKDNSHDQQEIGGYKGKDPTTYGDWQHKGRVSDF